MADEMNCVICEASFRPQAMEGEKCLSCNELYPKAHSRKDIKNPNKNKAETLTDVAVKRMVYEILEEAGFTRAECEKCKKKYFKNSASQKFCKACKESK